MSKYTLSIGIIGLPNVGKSTLFNALIKKQQALAANYPFATIEPNIGIVPVPDKRLNRLAEIVKIDYEGTLSGGVVPKKIVPATAKFVDIAGLVKNAHKGEGLGNQFLSHIREVDAMVHVIRSFEDLNVPRAGSVNPQEDIETINTELILADLQTLSKRTDTEQKKARGNDKESLSRLEIYKKLHETLNKGELANTLELNKEEKELIDDLNLLTLKPQILVYNIPEDAINKTPNGEMNTNSIHISAKLESELTQLNEEERQKYLEEVNMKSSGLDKIILRGYKVLNLVSFFTMNVNEVHAWTIENSTKAPKAGGKVHTDFEKGFISAEVIHFDVLDKIGSRKEAKNKGLLRIEGKNYVVKEGDVIEFRFSV